MKKFVIILISLLLSCNKESSKNTPTKIRAEQEIAASELLENARSSLANKEYDLARLYLSKIKEKYPRALNAREAGILIRDSIDLAETQEKLIQANENFTTNTIHGNNYNQAIIEELCQRIKFYQRKLDYDITHQKKH